jgi:hypothetical protein
MTSSRSTGPSARSSELRLRRALTHPVNVLVPAGVVVAGALAGAAWLTVVAIVCWVALVGMSYLDNEVPAPAPEASPLAPAIAARVHAAVAACAGIRTAIAASDAPLDDVADEVDGLLGAIRANAARAQRIHEFLAEGAAAQPAAMARLRGRLDALLAEIDHVVMTLQTARAEILAGEGAEQALYEQSLASQVSELHVKARIMSAGLEESLAETRAAGVDRDTEGR